MNDRLAMRLCKLASTARADRRRGITEAGLRTVCAREGHAPETVIGYARARGWLK